MGQIRKTSFFSTVAWPGTKRAHLARHFFLWWCAGAAALAATQAPLLPKDALASFQLDPGLRMELVASEPQVIDPVAMAFDEAGRLFVAENRDYPTGPRPGERQGGRIARLEDKDGDGHFEARIDFAEDLSYPNGLMPWHGGLFVTCAPDLLFLQDTNNDGKADVRKVVLTGFSTNSTTQLRVSHPTLSPDGWIYLTSGLGTGGNVYLADAPGQKRVEFKSDCRFDPLTGMFEPAEARAQFGMSFDEGGRRFICMNRVHVQHVVMPARYLKRNPHLTLTDAVQNCPEAMAPEPLKGHGAAARIYPIAEHVTTADSHEGTFTAACAVFVYRGDALGQGYHGNVFACEPTANLVHRDRLVAHGSTFLARRVEPSREFLASTDTWFRPVFLATGPDGALYVCDMYRQTIEHPEYLPQEVRRRTDFESGKGMGRIYRVTRPGSPHRPTRGLAKVDRQELCEELSSTNGWQRDTAHRLLLEPCPGNPMEQKRLAKALRAGLRQGRPGDLLRLRLLAASQALETDDLLRAFEHNDPGVREHALQLAETRLASSKPLAKAALAAAADGHPRVRLQCALTVGELERNAALPALVSIAAVDAHDPWTRLAILSSAAGAEAALLERFMAFVIEHPPSATNDGGAFALLHELGRLTGASRENTIRAPWQTLATGRESAVRIAALSGFAEGVRSRGQASPALADMIAPHAEAARKIAVDAAANPSLRQYAIALLGFGNYAHNRASLQPLLRASEPAAVQLTAVRALAHFTDARVVPDLISAEHWRLYTPVVREAVLNALLSDAKHLPAALKALEEGRLSAAAVDSSRRRQLMSHKDPAIKARAEALFKNPGSSNRMKVYEDWKSVSELAGSAANGRLVFRQHCGPCHRLEREGVNVGPDLFGMRNQPREAILLHIIVPEHEIAPGFTAYEIETRDGRSLAGLIVADTPAAVTIRGGQGSEETIARSNIASLTSSGLSLMPQEMEKNLTRQEMADLLAFLKGERER